MAVPCGRKVLRCRSVQARGDAQRPGPRAGDGSWYRPDGSGCWIRNPTQHSDRFAGGHRWATRGLGLLGSWASTRLGRGLRLGPSACPWHAHNCGASIFSCLFHFVTAQNGVMQSGSIIRLPFLGHGEGLDSAPDPPPSGKLLRQANGYQVALPCRDCTWHATFAARTKLPFERHTSDRAWEIARTESRVLQKIIVFLNRLIWSTSLRTSILSRPLVSTMFCVMLRG